MCNFLFFEIGLGPLICTLSSELNESEWCMSPLYYKQIINNLSAAITKKSTITKETQKLLVCSHRTQWKTLHSFIFYSVCSFQDWSMWSVRLSDRRKQKVTFHNWISNRSDWQPWKKQKNKIQVFIFQLPHRSQRKKSKSSVTSIDDEYGGKLDVGVSDIRTTSTELMSVTGEKSFWGSIYEHSSRGGGAASLRTQTKTSTPRRVMATAGLMTPHENETDWKRSASSCTES